MYVFYIHKRYIEFYFQSEDRNIGLLRDKGEIQSQLEENEEDLADIMKKYKAVVQQVGGGTADITLFVLWFYDLFNDLDITYCSIAMGIQCLAQGK